MKKTYVLTVILIILTAFSTCKLGNKEGTLYITDETHTGAEIFTLKILEPGFNQSSEKNIFSDYKETVNYGGYTWFVYDIPEGSWDIYLEYYEDDDFMNEREGVFIDGDSSGNGWAAIWLVENYDHSIWTEQGSGDLNIKSSFFN